MASEQAITNETIAKAVAEATRVTIQAMAEATAEKPQSMAGPKTGRPAMKQQSFNWETDNKYSKPKTSGSTVAGQCEDGETCQDRQTCNETTKLQLGDRQQV